VEIASPLVLLTVVSLAFGLVLSLAPSAHAAVSFTPQTTIPAVYPMMVAVDDFNGDDDPDLAVVNRVSDASNDRGSVMVVLGKAGASFGAPTAFRVGSYASSVATGDFNGDGDPDLAVTSEGSSPYGDAGTVSVFLGQAGGSFGARTTFPTGSPGDSIAVGDFNGDGDPDLAMADYNGHAVKVMPGGPGGSFGAPTSYAVANTPTGVAVGDFNGDGDPDLAVAIGTNFGPGGDTVAVLLGGPGAGFGAPTAFPVGHKPWGVAVDDFNSDGDPDLAVANYAGDTVSVLLGEPGGTFGAQTAYPARNGPFAVAVDDFDGNGYRDLAVTNLYSDNLSVLPGGAGASFGPQTVSPLGDEPRSIAVDDFDADGDPDLAVANFTSQMVSVLANTTSGVALDQASVAFPPTAAGSESAAQTVKLTNYGESDVSVGEVVLAGADAGGFVIIDDTCSGATLTTGEACSVSVRFHPARVGAHSARLEFTDDAPGNPHSAALSGTGTPPVAVSPSSIAWQPRPDSTESSYRTVTLTNLGEVDLAVGQLALAGTDASSFRLPASYDQCTDATLPSAQTCTVKVRFRPDGVGPKTARLQFTDDAVTSPQRVQLSGTGTPGPWLTPSVQRLEFGQVPLGTTTATKTVTLTNTGSAAMKISAISVGGANPGDFVGLSQTCTALASLGPDESCTAKIAFRPTVTGVRQARLTIDDTAPRNPHHVELRGTGT
jgi:hypothetical protein